MQDDVRPCLPFQVKSLSLRAIHGNDPPCIASDCGNPGRFPLLFARIKGGCGGVLRPTGLPQIGDGFRRPYEARGRPFALEAMQPPAACETPVLE